LPRRSLNRVLEVGYGSGIFQYTLAPRARVSVAIDIHPRGGDVRRQLAVDGIATDAVRGDGCVLPFRDHLFDVVVILSALEFVPDPEACLSEALRVLAPGGRVICLRPRVLPWADQIYERLVGFDPEEEFRGGRQRVSSALALAPARVRRFLRPSWLPHAFAPYELVVLDAGSARTSGGPAFARLPEASPV
jgi:SAM-dependent methyltransferase